MADAIVSAVLQQLATILIEQAKQKVELVTGVDREIENLTSNIQAIQAVLQDAERRQVKEASVRNWLGKLKEVFYDLEDVLDEWNNALLRLKIRQQQKPRNKVCSFLPSSCFCIKQLAFRHDIALKIKEINERLDFISAQKERFHFVIHERITDEERPRTTSYIDVAEVIGRRHDEAIVKGMLLSTPSGSSTQEEEAPRVISIVGMGGLGKTTLAQSIYNDGEVESHFDKRMWVCVSNPFDERRIANEIFEACTGQRPKVDAMDIILQQIRGHMSGKKLLLVLDDVWTEEFEKWKQLLNTLKCSLPGSRILVTTRNEKVAMILGSGQVDICHPEILNEEDSWSLFARLAFHDKTRDEIEMLEDVGRKIVSKCEGLPLAIKIIGSHLRFKRTRKEWQHVFKSRTWEIKDAERGLFGPLQLSYHELPSVSKRCFSYCALFPKDFQFQKHELIDLWMAQGFFEVAEEVKVIAEECFNDLVMRCFFQDLIRFDDGEIYGFKMHDIVHDFAIFLSEGECCSIDFNNMELLKNEASQKTMRHMLLNIDENQVQFPYNICGCKKLRSLHIQNNRWLETINVDLSALDWGQLICLRTLKLTHLQFEVLPKEVGKLEHLRCVELSDNSELRVLPEAICDLCNLETLNIKMCRSLKKLPRRIGELINLTYLYNLGTYSLECMPKGIGRLSKVKVIHNFVISMREKDASLAELGNLSNIEKIYITGLGNIRDVNECMKARWLEDKTKLRSLTLRFNRMEGGKVENEKEEQVLQALTPPLCIERLMITGYSGRDGLPNWMASLNNLKHFTLKECGELEQLPPLGKLQRLESLELESMQRVKKVGAEFLGISPAEMQQQLVVFPSLKKLTFLEMEEWEEWDWSDSEKEHPMITIMPHLSELSIHGCPRLTATPQQLLGKTALQELRIGRCPIVEERCKKGTGVDWPVISHIPRRHIGCFGVNIVPKGNLDWYWEDSYFCWKQLTGCMCVCIGNNFYKYLFSSPRTLPVLSSYRYQAVRFCSCRNSAFFVNGNSWINYWFCNNVCVAPGLETSLLYPNTLISKFFTAKCDLLVKFLV